MVKNLIGRRRIPFIDGEEVVGFDGRQRRKWQAGRN